MSDRVEFLISKEKLISNYRSLKSLIPTDCSLMCVVKANAYGHGIKEVGQILKKEGAEYYGVSTLGEGVTLREIGITEPIHVFTSITSPEEVQVCIEHNLEGMVSDFEVLGFLPPEVKVHIKADTGMSRQGVEFELFHQSIKELIPYSQNIIGVCSHFVSSEDTDESLTKEQIRKFKSVKLAYQSLPIDTSKVKFHIANSAGILFHKDSHFDIVRAGLSLYGMNPSDTREVELSYVGCLVSKIITFKTISGGGVSYDHKWKSDKPFQVACISIGYGDGYARAFSNNARVYIENLGFRDVVGLVCMDLIMVKLELSDKVVLGEKVYVLDGEHVTPDELAKRANTINYEITTNVSSRVRRVIV